MKNKIDKISEFEKRIKELRDQERKAFFEKNERVNKIVLQEYQDRIESGLLDIKKVKKYWELKKKRKIEKSEEKDSQKYMELHSKFLKEIKQYRKNDLVCEPRKNLRGWLFNPNPLMWEGSEYALSGPNQGGYQYDKPDETWKNDHKVGHPTNKVKLVASAEGGVLMKKDYPNTIEKYTWESSEEEAHFVFNLPDEIIPLPLGGTIEVSTFWIMSGFYDAQWDPDMQLGIPNPMSKIELKLVTGLNVWGDASKGDPLIPTGPIDVTGFPILGPPTNFGPWTPINESGVPIQLFWLGPSVQYPVKPGGGPYKALARIRVDCAASAGAGPAPDDFKPNVAKIDFSTPTDYSLGEIELVKILVQIIETPYYLVEQKKPPGVPLYKAWEPKIKPDILG